VLTYTSTPLPAATDLAGLVSATIFVRASREHADVFTRLCDVDDRGTSRNIVDGIRRLSPATVPAGPAGRGGGAARAGAPRLARSGNYGGILPVNCRPACLALPGDSFLAGVAPSFEEGSSGDRTGTAQERENVTFHTGPSRTVAPEFPAAISPCPAETRRPGTRHLAENNADEIIARRPSPDTTGRSRAGRRLQEILPPDIPRYLIPVVAALLSGQTDEAACRKLGISPRTFSRRVAEFLDYLNVSTRFQGGAELVRRGCRDCPFRSDGLLTRPL